uniref:Uncharacterized protein n=1 Tax=Fagus sylvatica TaxID=28930 RepID=A0A2N9ETB0_FAGSY
MAQLCGSDVNLFDSELDHVPLTQRRKLLRAASKRHSGSGGVVVRNASETKSMPRVDVVVKKEDMNCDSSSQGVLSFPSAFSARVGDHQLSKPQNYEDKDPRGISLEDPCCRILLGSAIDQCPQSYTFGKFVGMPGDGNHPGTQVNAFACSEQRRCSGVNTDVFVEEKLDANDCTLHKSQTLPVVPAKIKVEHSDNLPNSLGDGVNGFVGADVAAVVVKNEIPSNFPDDDLDHIVLKERRRMLLSRKLLELAKRDHKGTSGGLSEILIQQCSEKGKEETLVEGESVCGNQPYDKPERTASVSCNTLGTGLPDDIIAETSVINQYSRASTKSGDDMEIHASERNFSSERMIVESNLSEGQDYVPANTSSVCTSMSSTFVKVKVEPGDDSNFHNLDKNAIQNFSFNKLPLKSESGVSDKLYEDEVDHMLLRDRMKMPKWVEDSELNISRNSEYLKKSVPSALGCSLIASDSADPIRINRPRKRKKTVTDSVETAMEEDAPGLLKVLIDKGVSVDEIKLYGETESDEALDESLIEDSFSELEAVISKVCNSSEI